MRASRLLSILLLLQTRGRMTARELATELEVSVRSVYRDVDALAAAGVPVYGDRGPGGGFQLVEGFRTRLTGLTSAEAESLFLAGAPGPAAELGLGTVLAAAELKVLAALPPELRARAARIRERFYLEAPGWFSAADQTPYLAAVADAVWNQRRLRVRYQRWVGEVTRTLEPLGVVLKAGVWYLVARSEGKIHTYRVSRILELETLADGFERPDEFDLVAFWQAGTQQFEASVYRGEAVVRLSPRAIDSLPTLLDPVATRAARASAGPPDQDGWMVAVIPFVSIDLAVADLLRLGADAEVLAPNELRERMRDVSRALVEIYLRDACLESE